MMIHTHDHWSLYGEGPHKLPWRLLARVIDLSPLNLEDGIGLELDC